MQPKAHSDRFCLTSFTAAVVESAGQQVLNTQPGSGDAFHSYSAFCWLQRCCFRRGDDIIHNNKRPEREGVCASLEIALRPGSQLSLRHKIVAVGRNRWFIVSYFSLRMFFLSLRSPNGILRLQLSFAGCPLIYVLTAHSVSFWNQDTVKQQRVRLYNMNAWEELGCFKRFFILMLRRKERVKLELGDKKNLLINEVNVFIGDVQRSAPCNYTETVISPR